jgi:hypothetical protein
VPWDPTQSGSTSQADNQYVASASPALASAARTTSGNSSALPAAGLALGLELVVTAASGTTPSMTLSVEWSNDGTNWGTADPTDVFPAMTAAGRRFKHVTVKARLFRFVWTISGTTPSLTFTVNALPLS